MQIDLPSKFREINLGTWFEFHNATTDEGRLEAITGLPIETIRTIPLDQYSLILDAFLRVTAAPESNFQPTLRLGKVQYGIIPDLTKISVGEYLDLVNWCGEKSGGFKKNMLKIMACLYRPVVRSFGSRYQIADYHTSMKDGEMSGYREQIRQMPMDIVEGAMAFFLLLRLELLSNSPASLQNQTV